MGWLENPAGPNRQKELEMGQEVEQEHKSTLEQLIKDVQEGKLQSIEEYISAIAQDHLEELPDYYTRLKAMEEEGKAIARKSYIVHLPEHKNSQGESAPWVIKKHETGEILSSHKSKPAADDHLKQMHIHKHYTK